MEDWERIARNLPCGRSVRVKCCRGDRSQVISHTERGYSTYCFRCGEDSKQFRSHGHRSLAERLQHKKELEQYMHGGGVLEVPEDFTPNIPAAVLAWLLKAGVSYRLAQAYGIGWSPKLNRIVLPVWEGDTLIAVQSRAVYAGQFPKYLNKSGGVHKSPLFWSNPAYSLPEYSSNVLVITEDILSTIRVGRLFPAVSTLGTKLSIHRAVRSSIAQADMVLIWYDPDEAGTKGAQAAQKKLDLIGVPCTIIKSDKDPKEYDNATIQQKVNSHLALYRVRPMQ
jgi:hypothetical protein